MSNRDAYTVGWICAIHTEYVAARAFLDEKHDEPTSITVNDGNHYTLGRMGKHNVVIAVLPDGEYGTTSAAGVARNMLHSFPNVRIGLMVGIGGGAPSVKHDIRLGDVIVSAPRGGKGGVFQYDFGKMIQGQSFLTTGVLNQPPVVLRTAVAGIRARYEEEGHRIQESISQLLESKPRLRRRYGRPGNSSDLLFESCAIHPEDNENPCATLCGREPTNLVVRKPRNADEDDPVIHYGLIASANRLMKDAVIRDQLAQEEDVLCFEMEAAGLVNHFPCLVIRGICDYSDTHKNKDWQGYAAMTAVAYAKDLLSCIAPNQVEAERKLTDMLAGLEEIADDHRNVARKHLQIAQGAAEQQVSDRQKRCIQLFRLTRNDRDATYETYKGKIEDRVEGTCKWILEHRNFHAWLGKDNGSLLITADPGCGKSVLAKYLIDHVLPKTSTICYFFFKDQDQNTVRQALCALLHQLFCSKPTLIRHAMDRFDKEGEGLINSVSSLSSIFNKIVHDPEAGSITMVVDALDECFGSDESSQSKLRDLLQDIDRQCRKSRRDKGRLKYILTSRPYERILSVFRTFSDESSCIRIPGEDESATISREVDLFIKYRVEELAREKDLKPQLKDTLERQLVQVAHRTYLWVFLVIDFLRRTDFKRTERGIIDATKTLPINVNAAYSQMLSKSNDDKIVHKALAIILAADRPLTLAEMNVAMNVEPEIRSFDNLDLESEENFMISLRNWCGLFVSVHGGAIHLIHQTAREFLLAEATISPTVMPGLKWHHFITLSQAQVELGELCMRFLCLFKGRPLPAAIPRFGEPRFGRTDTLARRGEAFQAAIDQLTAGLPLAMRTFAIYAARFLRNNSLQSKNCTTQTSFLRLASEMLDPTSEPFKAWNCLDEESYHSPLFVNHGFTSPLQVGSVMGLSTVVAFLLQGSVDIERRDTKTGRTPLLWAVEMDHHEVAKLLVGGGANVNAQSNTGRSALDVAVLHGDKTLIILLLEKGAEINEALIFAASRGHTEIAELLLAKGADIDKAGGEHGCALGAAAYGGWRETVELLLKMRADINAQAGHFSSALAAAAYHGHEETVELLLAKGANVRKKGGKYSCALGVAVSSYWDKANVVRLILDADADMDVLIDGCNPLEAAAYHGNSDIVELLLNRGADVNKQGGKYGCALGAAVSCYHSRAAYNVTERLLKHGVNINAPCGDFGTALGLAASNGHRVMVERLIQLQANIHTVGGNFTNAITAAAYGGNEEIVTALFKKGADIHAQGKLFPNALAAAAYAGNKNVAELLLTWGADIYQQGGLYFNAIGSAVRGNKRFMVELLLSHGAEAKLANNAGWSPLLLASDQGNSSIVELLLDNGVVHTPNNEGWTPLMRTSYYGHVHTTRLLLARGADMTAANKFGQTSLYIAASQGHIEVVRLLLNKGVDVNIPNKRGRSPLRAAISNGHNEIAQLLRENNAVEVVTEFFFG
ncbi:hypothetical protein E8E12_000551 [Didymella heteroderae]|uniref:Nucleoside phosphorylase domain-containing protein n=1 Tax=Didymella heteroderae TaxID=1769908 RepID=A0A9P4WJV6_9PLEO|nr:hypothetical protein E8E12_000551 [Didymella heteroderae]